MQWSFGGNREVKVVVRMHEYCVLEAGGIRRNFRKSAFYENLTRAKFAAIRLVENSLDVPRSTQEDQSKSSLVSGPVKFFGPRSKGGTIVSDESHLRPMYTYVGQ